MSETTETLLSDAAKSAARILDDLALDIACTAESKGFWDPEGFGPLGIIGTKLALINSEVSEALDELRQVYEQIPPEDDPDAAEIPLYSGDGKLKGYALVDSSDYSSLMLWSWRIDTRGYVVRSGTGTSYLHREILGLKKGDGGVVDHINGNRLDNRRCNLRAIRPGENAQNRHNQTGTSTHRGVSWNSKEQCWRAAATVRGRTYHLGHFDSEREAAEKAAAFRRDNMPFSEEATQIRQLRESKFAEELADVIIRVLDLSGYYNLNLGQAVVEKIEKNRSRPQKHNKRF